MTDSYSIIGSNDSIHVKGTMKDDGYMEIVVNGETYTYDTSNGNLNRGPATADFHGDDGTVIKDTPATQEIRLSNGIRIEKTPATKKAHFPDGRTIRGDDLQDSGKSRTVEVDGNKIEVTVTSSGSTSSEESSGNYTRRDYVEDIIPGFWTSLIMGIGVLDAAPEVILLGLVMYCTYFIPSTIKYLGHRWADKEEDVESVDDEDEIAEIKREYTEGEIGENEFERRIEEQLGLDEEQAEIEYSYN